LSLRPGKRQRLWHGSTYELFQYRHRGVKDAGGIVVDSERLGNVVLGVSSFLLSVGGEHTFHVLLILLSSVTAMTGGNKPSSGAHESWVAQRERPLFVWVYQRRGHIVTKAEFEMEKRQHALSLAAEILAHNGLIGLFAQLS
jgi:hypothetical protein